MSIIEQQTLFTLRNESTHFLKIVISAEQDDTFHMLKNASPNVLPVMSNDARYQTDFVSTMIELVTNLIKGNRLKEIIVNLPAESDVAITISCTATLLVETSICSSTCENKIPGDFEIGPEYHGQPISCHWQETVENDDLAIDTSFFDKRGRKIAGPEVTPVTGRLVV